MTEQMWERECSHAPGPDPVLAPVLARIQAALTEARLEAVRYGFTELPAAIDAIERRVYDPKSWS
jgi:hypothetical protein